MGRTWKHKRIVSCPIFYTLWTGTAIILRTKLLASIRLVLPTCIRKLEFSTTEHVSIWRTTLALLRISVVSQLTWTRICPNWLSLGLPACSNLCPETSHCQWSMAALVRRHYEERKHWPIFSVLFTGTTIILTFCARDCAGELICHFGQESGPCACWCLCCWGEDKKEEEKAKQQADLAGELLGASQEQHGNSHLQCRVALLFLGRDMEKK